MNTRFVRTGSAAFVASALLAAALAPSPARAQDPAATPAQVSDLAPPPIAAPAPPPAPYSVPWQLRPVAAATVFRWDTALSFYENPMKESAETVASTMLVSYKIGSFAPLVRAAFVQNDTGTGGPGSGMSVVNPLLGVIYGLQPLPKLRVGLFLGATVPIGQGGSRPAAMDTTAAATAAGVYARSAMDNALFAVNYATVLPGFGIAYVDRGFTAQIEATVLQLTRVRNETVDADASRTNFTTGIHLGYFVHKQASIGTELRYQRWLSTPAVVKMFPDRRDSLSAAIGVRGHFRPGGKVWFRPGLAYARGFDAPMTTRGDNIIQLDLLFAL
jgi:hypothetical protein